MTGAREGLITARPCCKSTLEGESVHGRAFGFTLLPSFDSGESVDPALQRKQSLQASVDYVETPRCRCCLSSAGSSYVSLIACVIFCIDTLQGKEL